MASSSGGGGREIKVDEREKFSKKAGKRDRVDTSLEKEGDRTVKMVKAAEEYKVMFKLMDQSGGGFKAVNPLKLADSLRGIGEGLDARVLANGALLVICKNKDQVGKARKVGKLAGKKVEVSIFENVEMVKGVIYGVCADMTEGEIKDNIKGGKVYNVKRFKAREGGNPNAPVLISFIGKVLPERVFIGCLSYQVKAYQRPPVRCFKCQRYGHMAASCNGGRRCAKCGGDHDIVSCGELTLKCCNCGGSHMASSRECHQFMKAKQVQEIRDQKKMSYAEAVKKVERETSAQSVVNKPSSGSGSAGVSHSPPNNQEVLVVNKEDLLAFIVDVLFGTRERKSRSDIIKFVSEAAVRFLGLRDYTPQALHSFMRTSQMTMSQTDTGGEEETREEEEMCDIVEGEGGKNDV